MQIDTAFQRLRDANPVPDPAALRERRVESDVFLAATQQRSAKMQTQVKPVAMEPAPKPPNRRRWVPIAAAAVVAAVIAIPVLLSSGGDEPEVVDPVPTTTVVTTTVAPTTVTPTTVAPPPAVSSTPVALNYIAARDAWDGEAMASLTAPDALVSGEFVTSFESVSLAGFDRATGSRYLDPQCTEGSPGNVVCTYGHVDYITQALGLDAFDGGSFTFVIEDEVIQSVNHNTNWGAEYSSQVLEPLRFWVAINHPDDLPLMYEDQQRGLSLIRTTPDALDLWEPRIAEYVETLAG